MKNLENVTRFKFTTEYTPEGRAKTIKDDIRYLKYVKGMNSIQASRMLKIPLSQINVLWAEL